MFPIYIYPIKTLGDVPHLVSCSFFGSVSLDIHIFPSPLYIGHPQLQWMNQFAQLGVVMCWSVDVDYMASNLHLNKCLEEVQHISWMVMYHSRK